MTKRRSRSRARSRPKFASAGLLDLRSIEALLDQRGSSAPADPLDAAQEIIYDAWEAADSRKRVALAKRALKLSPLCADAYVLLAQEAARNLDETIDYYRQGVATAEKALGEACFRDEAGHFWGILETRLYMRAPRSYAGSLGERPTRRRCCALSRHASPQPKRQSGNSLPAP